MVCPNGFATWSLMGKQRMEKKKEKENGGSERKERKDRDLRNEAEEIRKIREKLKKQLKPDRYEHSLSVSFTSVCLAMRYGYDLHKAELAGLLHDCAKQFNKEELIRACRKDGVVLSQEMLDSPQVIHSIYGEFYARKAYGIEDREILSAIHNHTLGKPAMGLLDEIVFTADYIEVRRWKAQRLKEIRQLAFVDLQRAVYEILHDTVTYLEGTGSYVCRDSLDSYRYYENLVKKRGDTFVRPYN